MLTGEVDLPRCGGAFVLALGFGSDARRGRPPRPGQPAGRSRRAPGRIRPRLAGVAEDADSLEAGRPGGRDLYRISTAVLRTHEAQSSRRAHRQPLDSLGRGPGDDAKTGHGRLSPGLAPRPGGVGRRSAGGRATPEALRVLRYLRATQMADGHWPQNMWVSGAQYWTAIQLGETAFPILLLDLLRAARALLARTSARFWPMVRRGRRLHRPERAHRPSRTAGRTQRGYTPFTLAAVIAALLIAAELADEHGERPSRAYLRETADAWNDRHRELALRRRTPNWPGARRRGLLPAHRTRRIDRRSSRPGRSAQLDAQVSPPPKRGTATPDRDRQPRRTRPGAVRPAGAGRPADRQHGQGHRRPLKVETPAGPPGTATTATATARRQTARRTTASQAGSAAPGRC